VRTYAFISLRNESILSAVAKADAELASSFPGCQAHIVNDGCTRDGARWVAVRFEFCAGVLAAESIAFFLAELHRHGIGFWRLLSMV
jgi:hypothetical protein